MTLFVAPLFSEDDFIREDDTVVKPKEDWFGHWGIGVGTLKHEEFSGSITMVSANAEWYISRYFGLYIGIEVWAAGDDVVAVSEEGIKFHLLGRRRFDLSLGLGLMSFRSGETLYVDVPASVGVDLWMSRRIGLNVTGKTFLLSPGLYSVSGGLNFRI